jgi:DNA (cytosine-5)-methyltransferase 1
VVVHGVEYQIVDIGMRMLTPRELYLAQGFPDAYIIDRTKEGKQLSKASQVRMCGNSVSPVLAEVLVRANLSESSLFEAPANDNQKESAAA